MLISKSPLCNVLGSALDRHYVHFQSFLHEATAVPARGLCRKLPIRLVFNRLKTGVPLLPDARVSIASDSRHRLDDSVGVATDVGALNCLGSVSGAATRKLLQNAARRKDSRATATSVGGSQSPLDKGTDAT